MAKRKKRKGKGLRGSDVCAARVQAVYDGVDGVQRAAKQRNCKNAAALLRLTEAELKRAEGCPQARPARAEVADWRDYVGVVCRR